MSRFIPLLLTLALGACAAAGPPVASGPWRPLNPDRWQFQANLLTDPPPGIAR